MLSDREMVVAGGQGGQNILSTVEKYDVDGNMVELLPNLKRARLYQILKLTVHHFRCFDGDYFSTSILDFLSPRCLEPVGLTKSLEENLTILFSNFLKMHLL